MTGGKHTKPHRHTRDERWRLAASQLTRRDSEKGFVLVIISRAVNSEHQTVWLRSLVRWTKPQQTVIGNQQLLLEPGEQSIRHSICVRVLKNRAQCCILQLDARKIHSGQQCIAQMFHYFSIGQISIFQWFVVCNLEDWYSDGDLPRERCFWEQVPLFQNEKHFWLRRLLIRDLIALSSTF